MNVYDIRIKMYEENKEKIIIQDYKTAKELDVIYCYDDYYDNFNVEMIEIEENKLVLIVGD